MTRPEYVPAQASHEWQRPIWPDVHRYDSQGLAIEALTVPSVIPDPGRRHAARTQKNGLAVTQFIWKSADSF